MNQVEPPERQSTTDPETGRTVIRWTGSSARDQHLYFTSHSVTADGRYMLVISERSGAPNLHVIERADGAIRRLSHADALLRAYCYPGGTTRGFSKAAPYLDAQRNVAYWVQDDQAWRCGLDRGAEPEKLADLPTGWYTGFSHLSPDGRTFCVPCTDPRAFRDEDRTQADQLRAVPWAMIEQGLVTKLCLVDTEARTMRVHAELPFWVTHVQFDPTGSGRILCNCEGRVGAHAQRDFPYWGRLWGVESDGSWRRLYDQPEGEFLNHENWTPSGDAIIYHGTRDGAHFIAARTWDGRQLFEHDTRGTGVHHAISTPWLRRFTTDSNDGCVYLYDLDAPPTRHETRLCRHDTSYREQDMHAHPIMNPAGDGVVFTSDRDGVCNVYEVVLQD